MDRRIQARIVSRRCEERHEEQLAIRREKRRGRIKEKGEKEVRECGERENSHFEGGPMNPV